MTDESQGEKKEATIVEIPGQKKPDYARSALIKHLAREPDFAIVATMKDGICTIDVSNMPVEIAALMHNILYSHHMQKFSHLQSTPVGSA